MQRSAHMPRVRSVCCAACRHGLKMEQAATRSHHADKVRSRLPQRAPCADGSV
jgi:hypothetical protein